MLGTFCTQVMKFERGQLFRRYCVRCVHNTAHLGDAELHCRYLEYRQQHKGGREVIPDKKPTIRIPPDLRG
ncbi:hypothetical protein ES703_40259 [subsurface metagenome]